VPDIDDPFLEEVEPTAQQVGIDVPGSRSGFTDFINFGIFNGNFRLGPPNPAANVDVVGAAGSNFVPGWRFVQSSNTNITGSMVRNAAYPSGSNFRFTFAAGSANDEAYIEQLIDMGGSVNQDIGAIIRGYGSSSQNRAGLAVSTQYLTTDGTIAGMPPERTTLDSGGVGGRAPRYLFHPAEVDNPPGAARYLRLRVVANRQSVLAGTAFTIDVPEIRRERVTSNVRLVDRQLYGGAGVVSVGDFYMTGSNLLWQPASTTAGSTTTQRLLNYQLVPLPFSLVNIPANAVTELQLWGDTALALATPRIGIPWASAIVGASYRLSAIPTAGGASALAIRVQVGGSTVWTPFTIAGSGGALSNEASQVVTADELASGQQIGVVVDTSATYAPTTADLAVVVWVAVKYDGN